MSIPGLDRFFLVLITFIILHATYGFVLANIIHFMVKKVLYYFKLQ